MMDCKAIVSDIELRTGHQIVPKVVQGRNGPILKVYPWLDLETKWKRLHVECTPERLRGNGYSVHLDFYVDGSVIGSDATARSEMLHALKEEKPTALLVIGQPFDLNPRLNKAHILVEQVDCVPFNAWASDAKIAELMAHYVTAFAPTIVRVAHG